MKLLRNALLSLLFASFFNSSNAIEANGFEPQKAAFQENKGQVTGTDKDRVQFVYTNENLSIFLLENGLAYQFSKPSEKGNLETFRFDLELVNANSKPIISTASSRSDYTHYYNHNALFVKHYQQVTYHDVYPNIDWVLRTTDKGIKYDFIVHPGGKVEDIQLNVKHADHVQLGGFGSLIIETALGNIVESKPISYQNDHTLESHFILEGTTIRFDVEEYDPSQALVIDPSVVWSTYYGGTEQEYAYSTCTDANQNVYITGFTKSTTQIASGGHQNSLSGSNFADAFVVKFDDKGKRQWASYYGGTGEDRGHGVAVDKDGNVFVAGRTRSSSNIAKDGALNTFRGIEDGFLVKFNSSGVRQWGTYYGGRGVDYANGVAVDKDGNSYIIVSSNSNTYKAVVVKYDKNGSRSWNSILGNQLFGTFGNAIAYDPAGAIYVTGRTAATSGIATKGHQNTYAGGNDGFLIKINLTGTTLWGTYYGGSDLDDCTGVTVDDSSNVIMVGSTKSTSGIASNGHQNTIDANVDAFVVKFNANGVRKWASYYGGDQYDYFSGVSTDTAYNVYCSGYTGSTKNITGNGIQNTFGGGSSDGLLVKFDASGVRQFGTYYGGNDVDRLYSVDVDELDNIVVAGYTKTKNFFNKNAHQSSLGGDYDAVLVKISQCVADPGVDVVEECDSYTWIDGKTYTASTNAPTFTLTSADGCDSVVTLNLTINTSPRRTETVEFCGASYTIPGGSTYTKSGQYEYLVSAAGKCDSIITLDLTLTNITKEVTLINGPGLRSNELGARYQWLDCEKNFEKIDGETGRIFNFTQDGEYAVEVTKNGCVDTSVCTVVTPSGIEDFHHEQIRLYPNPNNGSFHLDLGAVSGKLVIRDVNGRLVYEKGDVQGKTKIESDLESGIYLVHVQTTDGSWTYPMVVRD
jgi:hypothetical protein